MTSIGKERVLQRLDLVGTSAGTVVSCATWCALHAQDADLVVSCLVDKMKATATSDSTRASLLYVLHEILLTCTSRGTTDAGRRGVLVAISKRLPPALQAVQSLSGPLAEMEAFTEALGKVAEWWAILRVFPEAWVADLRSKHSALQDAAASSNTGVATNSEVSGLTMLRALERTTRLMARYQAAKQQWARRKHQHSLELQRQQQGTPEGDMEPATSSITDADLESACDGALRTLVPLRKAAETSLGAGSSLVEWCEYQRAELEGRAPNMIRGIASSRMKIEEGLDEKPGADDDDVLGSFY